MKSDVLSSEFVSSEKITSDYINYAPHLKAMFPRHFREPSLRKCKVGHRGLVDKLLKYNKSIGAPLRVIQNIESLLQPEIYAVITGQQPGLLSGPLYTVYKAISTLAICERLSTQKYSLVPIFWNASEDHDFSEVSYIKLFKENKVYAIHYDDVAKDVALSHLNLDKSQMIKILTIIESISPDSEFKMGLMLKIKEILGKSSTIGDFFSRFMTFLFGEFGLIMIEPYYFRDLMAPIFARMIKTPTKCTKILNEAGLQLKRLGYSPRIHKKSNMCNFFLLDDDGKRLQITYNGKFQSANETFSQAELLDLLDEDPSRFSANAATRPITQDFLFPTFAYVAGPNEIAYQAQLKGLYDFFSLEMPVIFPRFGATVVERKVVKVLEKYSVTIYELQNPAKLLKELAKKKIENTFGSFKSEISGNISELIQQAKTIDEGLIESCLLAKGRILKTIDILEDKIAAKLKKQNLLVKQQITKAHNHLLPNNQLQEREINVLEYLMKFGKRFLRTVYERFLDADYGEHKVIKC
ncbi:MAG: bacillithiol biosynthesis cysteine-adding enzyme BshC [Candidatus Bathyarchaeota archaeon]|nr:MAG: bacillithiol biosynthesis cysteine-adding enzyme BshC [Candidatus Bathyarchaeota archaeon]